MDNNTKVALIASVFTLIGYLMITPSLHFWVNEPPKIEGLLPIPSGPQPSGSNITWTAKASDPNHDPIEYKFQLNGPSTNNRWVDQQGWSPVNDWCWLTTDLDIGNNSVQVLIRDKKHELSDEGDDLKISSYYITDAPNAYDLYTNGDSFYRSGNYGEAVKYYRKSLELNSNDEIVCSNLGDAYYYLGNYHEALQAYDNSTKSNQSYARAWDREGWALDKLKRPEESKKAFETARRLGYKG